MDTCTGFFKTVAFSGRAATSYSSPIADRTLAKISHRLNLKLSHGK